MKLENGAKAHLPYRYEAALCGLYFIVGNQVFCGYFFNVCKIGKGSVLSEIIMNEIKRLLDDALVNHGVPCSDIAISVNNQLVCRYMNGTSDEKKSISLNGKELYFLYSATKLITCTAALQLYEKGLINLEDEISKYIPEYRNVMIKSGTDVVPAQKPMKIKHLFTMTSGLNYDLGSFAIRQQIEKNSQSSTLELVKAMAGNPLEFEPGTHYLYGLSHDVLAAVIEIVSRVPYEEYVKKHIFDVCGMKHTYVGCPEEVKTQMCCQYMYDAQNKVVKVIEKKNPFILTANYQSGGAGIVSCVEDYMLFANAMVNGEKLLKKSTIDFMRENHITGAAYEDFQNCKQGYSYGLGVRTNIHGLFSVKGEFGWDGAAGAYVMLDPDNHIALFYATHVLGYSGYLYKELHPALRDVVYRTMGIRK